MKNLAIPESIQSAEAGVLGGCILRPAILRDLELGVADFGHWPHQVVFMAMRNLEAEGKPIDTLMLENEIAKLGKLDAIGGPALLGELCLRVPTVDNVHAYAQVVRDQHLRRRVLAAAGDVVHLAESSDCTGEELLDAANARLGAIDGAEPDIAKGIAQITRERFADIERFAQEMAAGRRALSGVPTGVKKLDAKTGGWQFSIVNLIAARPGMGKSAMALASADASSDAGFGAHVFSLEDSEKNYGDRELARLSGVAASKIRAAELDRDDVGHLYAAVMRMRQRDNWIVDERSGLSAVEIVRSVRRRAEKNNTKLVVVDYLNLVRRPRRGSETEELGEVMQIFCDAAKADRMAYLVLAQLNRELEKRIDKRPQLSDLRGSGEIEEKCKLAIGLYRGSYYGGKPKRGVDYDCDCPEPARACAHTPTLEDWERQIQIVVMKGGNGPTGQLFAEWDGPTTRIS